MPASNAHHAGITTVDAGHPQGQNQQAPSLALGEFMLGTSDWVYSLALVILAYQLTGSLAWVAGVLLFQAAGRLIVISLGGGFRSYAGNQRTTLIGLARPLLIASLLLVTSDGRLWWAVIVAGLMGASGAIYDSARAAAPDQPQLLQNAGLVQELLSRPDRISMITGSLLGGALIVAWDVEVAFVVAAALGAAGALTFARTSSNPARAPASQDGRVQQPVWDTLRAMPAFRRVVVALGIGAALGIGLRVTLVDVVLGQHGNSELIYALMIAFAGVGTLYTPVSVPRLLGKLGPELVLSGTIVALAASLVFIQVARPLAILIPVVFVCGILAITGDRVAETLTRRLIPDSALDGALHLLAIAAVAGQALALAILLAIEPSIDALVAGLVLAGAGIIFAALILKGYMTASLERVRGNDLDERRAAER